jgi:hypothetical protein
MKKLINVTVILLLSGSSILLIVGCQPEEREDIEIKSRFFVLGYELDFKSYKDSLHEITPIDIDCDFEFVNHTNEKKDFYFNYNNSSVDNFDRSQKGALFYTIANDSIIALQPLQESATIRPQDHSIVTVKFRYRVSGSLRDSLKGNSMEQITSKVSNIDLFFKRLSATDLDSLRIQPDDLHVYFMFNDTSITCSPKKGCVPFIDPIVLLKEK